MVDEVQLQIVIAQNNFESRMLESHFKLGHWNSI